MNQLLVELERECDVLNLIVRQGQGFDLRIQENGNHSQIRGGMTSDTQRGVVTPTILGTEGGRLGKVEGKEEKNDKVPAPPSRHPAAVFSLKEHRQNQILVLLCFCFL